MRSGGLSIIDNNEALSIDEMTKEVEKHEGRYLRILGLDKINERGMKDEFNREYNLVQAIIMWAIPHLRYGAGFLDKGRILKVGQNNFESKGDNV